MIETIHKELQLLREPKIRASMARARVQSYEEGEKPSKYFCNLEKRNAVNKTISCLEVNGKILTEQNDILSAQKTFYHSLYTTSKHLDSSSTKQFLNPKNITGLSETQKELCEGHVSEDEVKDAIRLMKNNKTPGTDGLPSEFYKFFWNDIKIFLLRSYNEAFKNGGLSITQTQGIITCLPKGNKPRQYLQNWRPITLLNVDYKILSSVIANRMKKVLPDIISNNQKGFLKGRYIGENIRTIYDLIEVLENSQSKALLLLVDFEKAFDSIEWTYIRKVLKSYNFGNDLLAWFDILYKEPKSCVLNNGHFSEFFSLSKSCRQGDPLSPYLFILSIEPLSMEIKNNKNIKGINLGDVDMKIGQYADDTFVILEDSEISLQNCINIFENFQKCSGLKMNLEKTQAVWLGVKDENQKRLCPNLKLNWSQNFTLLGIAFKSNIPETIEFNYNLKLNEIEKTLNAYSKRYLSLLGKITVIKALLIPKLVYILTVLPGPSFDFIHKVENLFRNFIWNSGKPRITLSKLAKDIPDGGLKLTDLTFFNYALKISWVKRLVKGTGNWQYLFELATGLNKRSVWDLDVVSLEKVSQNIQNNFWKEVFKAWTKYKKIYSEEIDVRSYPIWDSYFISNPNLDNRKKEMISKGVIYINDIVDNNGLIYGYEEFCEKFEVNLNFMDFYSLTHSIPREWKIIIGYKSSKLTSEKLIQKCLSTICKKKSVCQEVYWSFVNSKESPDKYLNRWNNRLSIQLHSSVWQELFSVNFKATIESKLRAFQYKILTRTIVTNSWLFKCNITCSDLCYFCKQESETIEHLFWNCSHVTNLLISIKNGLAPCLHWENLFNCQNFLLGVTEGDNAMLINHLFMIIKRYIYTTRCKEGVLNEADLLHYIRYHYELECNMIVHKKGNGHILQKKWNPIHLMLISQ